MTTPHIHAEVIKAWADGAIIEFFYSYDQSWQPTKGNKPSWNEADTYRVKPPESKKVKMWNALYKSGSTYMCSDASFRNKEEAIQAWKTDFVKLLPHTEIEIEVTE